MRRRTISPWTRWRPPTEECHEPRAAPWYDSASFAPTVGFVKRQMRWAWFTRTWTIRNGGANIETIAVKRKGRQRFERQRIRQGRHKQNSHSGTPIRQGYGYHQPSDSKVANHSDDKAKGKITFQQANKKAVEAIHKARNTKSKSLQRKPLDYLERICENGWIREAVRKIPELYPYLDHPDLWLRKGV